MELHGCTENRLPHLCPECFPTAGDGPQLLQPRLHPIHEDAVVMTYSGHAPVYLREG